MSDSTNSAGGFVPNHLSRYHNTALIAAGGSGERMGAGIAKQFIEVGGLPAVVRTLLVFQKSPLITDIVVVGRPGDEELYREFASHYGIDKLAAVAEGGETRQESVLSGLKCVSDKSRFLLIHDAVRCLVTGELIQRTLEAAHKHGCSCAGHGITDTVKKIEKGAIVETLDRSSLWLAATPQVFQTRIYRAVAYYAAENDFESTDDASLAEHVGYKVCPVDCGNTNIKLTYPGDVELAEFILKSRGENI